MLGGQMVAPDHLNCGQNEIPAQAWLGAFGESIAPNPRMPDNRRKEFVAAEVGGAAFCS